MKVKVDTPNKGTLNLRVLPSYSTIIAQIPNETQLDAIVDGEWAKVTYNGKVGYVQTKFLATIEDKVITKDDLQTIYNDLKKALETIETILK